MKITIQYYGTFRNLGQNIILNFDEPTSVRNIKYALATHINPTHKAILEDSALADDASILHENFIIDKECTLSILPPVCGG